jgi:cytochrome c-type biogenesis protein CcmH
MLAFVGIILAVALADPPAGDPALELRARTLEEKIIAPCCWQQPVSQHYSEAATNIRRQIREMLSAGKSEEQILEYYVAEYGERILASPRARGFNILAYVLPWAALAAGMAVLVLALRRWLSRKVLPVPGEIPSSPGPAADYDARIEKELRQFD